MTSALSITQSANPPRSVFLDYPLGHTAGPPGDPDTQLDIMRQALAAFSELTESGAHITLDHRWASEWKTEARSLADHRSPRHDTPQYQNDADRTAAVDRHGPVAACEVCDPATTPVS